MWILQGTGLYYQKIFLKRVTLPSWGGAGSGDSSLGCNLGYFLFIYLKQAVFQEWMSEFFFRKGEVHQLNLGTSDLVRNKSCVWIMEMLSAIKLVELSGECEEGRVDFLLEDGVWSISYNSNMCS